MSQSVHNLQGVFSIKLTYLQGRASMHIICCPVIIVLHKVLLFWYLTEAAHSSPSGVTNEGDVLYCRNSAWPVANEGHHYQRSCEVTGVKRRGVRSGGTVSTKGRDETNLPHCIILSYWCWLYSVFTFAVTLLTRFRALTAGESLPTLRPSSLMQQHLCDRR